MGSRVAMPGSFTTWIVQPLANRVKSMSTARRMHVLPKERGEAPHFGDRQAILSAVDDPAKFRFRARATSPRSPPAGKGTPPTAVGGVALIEQALISWEVRRR